MPDFEKSYIDKFLEEMDSLDKPMNIRERRVLYRYFYHTNPQAANFIDANSFKICKLDTTDLKKESFIFNFFNRMFERLNLLEIISQIIREYLLFGNCTVFAEHEETSTVKSSRYDIAKNILFDLESNWSRILILPPDQVKIRKIPLSNDVVMEYVPDPLTVNFLHTVEASQNLINYISENGSIPLNTNPDFGSFTHLFSRNVMQYETLGVSIIERHLKELIAGNNISIEFTKAEEELINSKIKKYIEEYLFKPVAVRNGFHPADRNDVVLYSEVIIS